jgi:hypothetical protein
MNGLTGRPHTDKQHQIAAAQRVLFGGGLGR